MREGNGSQRRLMGQKDGQRERKREDSQSHSEHQTKCNGRESGKMEKTEK